MNRRRMMLGMVTLPLAMSLAGCGSKPKYIWRYKLTLELDTPDGVKSGFNVVEVVQGASWYENTIGTAATGEALYLDLGPGRRPLIALLTQTSRSGANRFIYVAWAALMALEGRKLEWHSGVNENLGRAIRRRGEIEIGTADLPDLVTFADPGVPGSVMRVDPNDLATSFGGGVRWRRMSLAITDAPLTRGIEKRLSWLNNYYDKMLDGHKPGQRGDGSLASKMNTGSFLSGER